MILSAGTAWSQAQVTTGKVTTGVDASGNSPIRSNTSVANKPKAIPNKIIIPVALSTESEHNALKNIDRNISVQVSDLSEKLKAILPDELAMLTKTNGWKTDDQQALVTALRAGDRTGVYEAWVKGNSKDIAGAELAARQTELNRLMLRLVQDAEKNKAETEKNKSSLKQDLADFDVALGKISGSTPTVSELAPQIKTLKTWVEARRLIETATPAKGSVAKLPTGNDTTLVFDPTLPVGTAVVLSDSAMLIGQEGKTSLEITTGNAAEALGLPIVLGAALPEAEGEEVTSGVLIVNPASSKATINYNINGNHYVAQAGMQQKLVAPKEGKPWTIDFDRGEKFGTATHGLPEGTYYFTPTDRGWQLYRQRFEIVLDNSQNNQEFNFIFHGEDQIVPAGGTRTLTANYPVVIRFDRGNGSQFVAKETAMTVGSLQIGVNSNDNLWDLFPMNGNKREVSKLRPFNADTRGNVK
jgi:hypothetical protein